MQYFLQAIKIINQNKNMSDDFDEKDELPITKGDLKLLNYRLQEMKNGIDSISRQIREDDTKFLKKETFDTFKTEEFKPIKDILGRLNWLVLSTVILALLALVIVGATRATAARSGSLQQQQQLK